MMNPWATRHVTNLSISAAAEMLLAKNVVSNKEYMLKCPITEDWECCTADAVLTRGGVLVLLDRDQNVRKWCCGKPDRQWAGSLYTLPCMLTTDFVEPAIPCHHWRNATSHGGSSVTELTSTCKVSHNLARLGWPGTEVLKEPSMKSYDSRIR